MDLSALAKQKPLTDIITKEQGLDLSSLLRKITKPPFYVSPTHLIQKGAEKIIPFAAEIGKEIARNIGSAGVTLAKPIAKKLYGQEIDVVSVPEFLQGIFKEEPIKSIELRIVEAETKIKDWGEKNKKFTSLGKIASEYPTSLAFAGVMGSVGIDLTPFGGLEKNAFKEIIKVKSILEASTILRKLNVAEDLVREFAPEIVKVKDVKQAKKLLTHIAEVSRTTKPITEGIKIITRKEPTMIKGAGREAITVKGHPEIYTDAYLLIEDRVPQEVVKWHSRLKPSYREIDYSTVKGLYPKAMTKLTDFLGFEKVDYGNPIAHLNIGTEKSVGINAEYYQWLKKEGYKIKSTGNEIEPLVLERNGKDVGLLMPIREVGKSIKKLKMPTEIKAELKEQIISEIPEEMIGKNLPAVIRGETFTLGVAEEAVRPTIKEARIALKAEIKAIKQEIKNAEIAAKKAAKLEARQQKIRQDTIDNINRIAKGNVENIQAELKAKYLSDEDIANIVLEDGTKLSDVIKVKRNADKSLSTYITKKEIDDIAKNYTDEIPKAKWEKRSILVEGVEIPIKAAKSIELPYVFFERKGLTQIYDPIIQAGRDAENLKNYYLQRFKDAGLYKEGGWFSANRFNLSSSEAEGVSRYFLGRQGRGKVMALESLSPRSQKFIEIFDGIIKETEQSFFELAKKMGKTPGKVKNYAPLMTSKDIKLVDEGGSMDWLFRNHPAFFSLKERAKRVPAELYEKDYREVAARWLQGITDFLNYGDMTNHLKYLINSDQFKNVVKESDWQMISKWLQDITTPSKPVSAGGQAANALSKLLRKSVAIGSLGLNYATVLKQALTQIPIAIINKSLPKLKSQYAEAFGISVRDLPSITKRSGDIAIQDLQGKIGRIFTGAITEFDRKNAQIALNGLLDKEYDKFLKQGVEITPEIQKLIEKKSQDALDMWFGGFFKGQRPEAFREEVGNFILMFLYPLTSQLSGFYRHILQAKGISKIKAGAEVLAAATVIAYAEQVIENLSPEWSDKQGMTKDILLSLSGNIPLVGNIAYSIANETDFQISPVLGNFSNILRAMGKGDKEKILFTTLETMGLPRQVRRIREGLQIMEEGGITDSEGKMSAPVQDTMELVRSFLRGKYGSMAAQDWIRNIGEKSEDRRWFVPQVEFLQNGDYNRKAELYKQFNQEEQKELRGFLSEAQQKKLDKAQKNKSLKEIFTGKKSLDEIFK